MVKEYNTIKFFNTMYRFIHAYTSMALYTHKHILTSMALPGIKMDYYSLLKVNIIIYLRLNDPKLRVI